MLDFEISHKNVEYLNYFYINHMCNCSNMLGSVKYVNEINFTYFCICLFHFLEYSY